jgi:archaellum component FlaC
MVENVADLTLERVRRLEGKIDMLVDHVVEVKVGLTPFKSEMAHLHAQMAHQSQHLDGIEARLSRVERRLDLVDSL